MKIKLKNVIAFLLLFFVVFSISTQINIKNCNEPTQGEIGIRRLNLKQAGSWNNFTFIHFTDLNWTVASNYDWCSGSGTWGDPYLIENMIINASDSPTGSGIFIENSVNVYFTIRNVTIFETTNGIRLENTNKGTLVNNLLSNNIESGIYAENCVNNTISTNQLINNGKYGLYLYSNCLNNKIIGNTVKNNGAIFGDAGIYLANLCNDNEIRGNNVYDNNVYGINLENSCEGNLIYNNTLKNIVSNQQDYGIRLNSACHQNNISRNLMENLDNYGIYLISSDGNSISNNKIFDISTGMYILIAQQSELMSNTISGGSIAISMSACNDGDIIGNFINNTASYGIRIYTNSDDNEFSDNIIKDNIGIGIELYTPLNDNNLFYKNSFISNGVHVFDNGTANFWNNTMIGNYWDNYTGSDLDNNHIGDTPFNILGGANSIDNLPIVDHDSPSIIINTPTSSIYGSNAPEFNIIVNETYIYSMWYTINNSVKRYYFTENGTINQGAWDALNDGNVIITFYVRDITWKIGSNSIDLIKSSSQGPDGGPFPFQIIIIIIISIILILVIIITGVVARGMTIKRKIKKSRNLNEEQLEKAQYFKDVTSILTILAIHKESGLCLSKIALQEGIGLDENLFTGFISAMGSFKNELAKQMGLRVRGEGGDNTIVYNEFTITLMDGEYLRLGLVSHKSLGDSIKVHCGQVLRAYEIKRVNDLKNFDGEIQIFKDFEETIETGLDMNLNKKSFLNVKELSKYNAHESFKNILIDFSSRSEGFYPSEIAVILVQEMNISSQEAHFMVYEAYKNHLFIPIT
ncbi:MAG: nitrous oxide reductase family maturation protein NosD [Candidatus Hermodarchaeota archaeon]